MHAVARDDLRANIAGLLEDGSRCFLADEVRVVAESKTDASGASGDGFGELRVHVIPPTRNHLVVHLELGAPLVHAVCWRDAVSSSYAGGFESVGSSLAYLGGVCHVGVVDNCCGAGVD